MIPYFFVLWVRQKSEFTMNIKRPFFVYFVLISSDVAQTLGTNGFVKTAVALSWDRECLGQRPHKRLADRSVVLSCLSSFLTLSLPKNLFCWCHSFPKECRTGKANQPERSFSRTLPLLSMRGQNSCRTVTSVLSRHCDRRETLRQVHDMTS